MPLSKRAGKCPALSSSVFPRPDRKPTTIDEIVDGWSAIRKLPILYSQLVLDRLLSECLWRQPA
jgi:hypothetical protein